MAGNLTSSLEDYLETIYLLQHGTFREARVRDIAAARSVKASSVSPALKRLSEMGYLAYEQRESIRLTDEGTAAARRVYARHVLLFQFFHDILGMPADKAREEACGLEHALSDEGMDRFVRFFESRSMCHCAGCSRAATDECALVSADAGARDVCCTTLDRVENRIEVTVLMIRASGAERQEILEMGILPNVRIVRKSTTSEGIIVTVEAHELLLSVEQTRAIVVTLPEKG